jgi:hypothetical protein
LRAGTHDDHALVESITTTECGYGMPSQRKELPIQPWIQLRPDAYPQKSSTTDSKAHCDESETCNFRFFLHYGTSLSFNIRSGSCWQPIANGRNGSVYEVIAFMISKSFYLAQQFLALPFTDSAPSRPGS